MSKEQILKSITYFLPRLNQYKINVTNLSIDIEFTHLIDKTIDYYKSLEELITTHDIPINYTNLFHQDVTKLQSFFGVANVKSIEKSNTSGSSPLTKLIESNIIPLKEYLLLSEFNLSFFHKVNFLNSNIVAIGANGSGKTSLTEKFKLYIQGNGVVISAQRILNLPVFDSFYNPSKLASSLKTAQLKPKSNSTSDIFRILESEFGVVIQNLLASNISTSTTFRANAVKALQQAINITPPETSLDRTFNIWNDLIEHRVLNCIDGINIIVTEKNRKGSYNVNQMSEGEKVMLFLIAQVLQAPESGFIIIDEPEMYLHKTIVSKLWDILEHERKDCIFIYLTHDLDFASSRISAQKIWIKSFTYPDKWDIEVIPKNELPEPLLLQLLGSRKSILFCEGKKGSIDERIYNILFPNYTVTPVENCFAVMNYTKAFNKLPNSTTKAFGIIDADYHDKARLTALETENVFSFSMVEPENLLLDETFITLLAQHFYKKPEDIKHIKDEVIKQLQTDIKQQVSNYVSSKINHYFKNSHLVKGNTLAAIQKNHAQFIQDIKIEEWFEHREEELNAIIQAKDYQKALSVFNNKGLKAIAIKHLSTTDFQNTALRFLQDNPAAQEALKQHFKNFINAQASQ